MPRSDPQTLLRLEQLLWDLGYQCVAGVDEAGLGPWAGPVVAAAVYFPSGASGLEVDDSKKLSAKDRHNLAPQIREQSQAWSLGIVSAEELDQVGARKAGLEAMRRAVQGLQPPADYLLVDARSVPGVAVGQSSYVRADTFIHCVAAASILAKVHRDGLMQEIAKRYPGYGFERHMGYGTKIHAQALARLGPCAEHRRSFSPVARALAEPGGNQTGE